MPMKNPPHPGSFVLRQCIEPLGVTITQAAAALGVTRTTLSELVNEKRGISPEMAVRLSKVFGGSAESWLVQQAARHKGKIITALVAAKEFYLAEDYHQKYRLRSDSDLFRELHIMYPANQDFVNSTVAARINGYLDGYGTLADLQEELPGFGLSPTAGKELTDIVRRRAGRSGCKL